MSLFSLVLGILILALFNSFSQFDLIVCFVIVLFSVGYMFDIAKLKQYQKYSVPLALAFIARIALLFYDIYSNDPLNLPLIGGELTSDPYRFYNSAVYFSQGQYNGYGGYFSKFIGLIFRLTGPSRLWAEFIVVLFSIATVHVAVAIVNELDISQKARRNSIYFVGLLPNYMLLSVVFRRETIITFLLALSLLNLVRWISKGGRLAHFIWACVFGLVASMFHGGTGLIVAGYIFMYLLYDPGRNSFKMKQSHMVGSIFLMGACVLVFLMYGPTFFNKLSRLSGGMEDVAAVYEKGGSSYAKYVGDSKTPLRILIFSVPRYLYFMFSPFPWQWRGFADIITFLMSSCPYLYVMLSGIRLIRRTPKRNRNRNIVIIFLVVAVIIAFVFSWGVTNTGTATRHRDKFIVLYTIMFAIIQQHRMEKKQTIGRLEENNGK